LLVALRVVRDLCGASSLASASQRIAKAKIHSQKFVEDTLAMHPEADQFSITVGSSQGCQTIASPDSGDISEPCENEDSEPMRTGKP
jgi:hypothetical protein